MATHASQRFELIHADCRTVMSNMGDDSVDSIVCDPPYELTSISKRFGGPNAKPAKFGKDGAFQRASGGFMNMTWDSTGIAFDADMWCEALRVLRPGGHMLAFSGSRTYHRMAVAIEDAGFEIRDQIMWLYGSGFPKSHDVSKGIDKAAGAERAVVGERVRLGDAASYPDEITGYHGGGNGSSITAPATPEAQQWQGWGTALKPAHEPIVLARKPLIGTVAANVLAHGTGGINIDGCRIEGADVPEGRSRHGGGLMQGSSFQMPDSVSSMPAGRFPANVMHDGSDEVLAGFPVNAGGGYGTRGSAKSAGGLQSDAGWGTKNTGEMVGYGDSGSAARFFYCAKASKNDRGGENTHPTVKPEPLMRYLVRLITPPGGVVFDPFTGSGSTGKAAMLEGFRFIGAELTAEYVPIARARIQAALDAYVIAA